ncbi:hypothetical protein C0J52_20891 [Blattella germanica]|nr:hypothetical protein C0J52_20891 [Blattella germanica]
MNKLLNNSHHIAFTDGDNGAAQFLCCYSAVITNELIDSLSIVWSHCSHRPATPLFVSQRCLPFSFVTVTNPSSNSADIHCCITIHIINRAEFKFFI